MSLWLKYLSSGSNIQAFLRSCIDPGLYLALNRLESCNVLVDTTAGA